MRGAGFGEPAHSQCQRRVITTSEYSAGTIMPRLPPIEAVSAKAIRSSSRALAPSVPTVWKALFIGP